MERAQAAHVDGPVTASRTRHLIVNKANDSTADMSTDGESNCPLRSMTMADNFTNEDPPRTTDTEDGTNSDYGHNDGKGGNTRQSHAHDEQDSSQAITRAKRDQHANQPRTTEAEDRKNSDYGHGERGNAEQAHTQDEQASSQAITGTKRVQNANQPTATEAEDMTNSDYGHDGEEGNAQQSQAHDEQASSQAITGAKRDQNAKQTPPNGAANIQYYTENDDSDEQSNVLTANNKGHQRKPTTAATTLIAMENHYDPEHHDIWGDGEDGQQDQQAPRVPINADAMKSEQAAQSLTYNVIPIHYEDDPPAIEFNSAAVARHSGPRTERDRMPEDAPLRARFASPPNGSQTAVRSTAPRHDNDNQPPDTTDRTKNNMTAVRSPAPRPWHTTVRHNKTTSRGPRPLCVIGLMTHIILLLLHNGDSGAEPCSPPTNTTNLTTYQNTTTHHGLANGGAERCSPPTTPTAATVRSPAPRPRHHPNHTIHAMHDTATVLHQRLGIHPVLNITPLPSHVPQSSQTRNCRKTAFSHRSIPPSQPLPAWRCRSVIVSGAGPPVCLPAAGSVKGIKHALHHLRPHLPPPQHQRLFYQGQPLGDHEPTPTTTTTGPIHLTVRLVGLKGGGRRSRRDTDSDSTSDSDSDSYSRRKKSRKHSSKGELTQALRAMTSLADSVAAICRSIQQPQQTVTPEAPAPQRSADRHSDQARTQAEPSQGEAEPQARRRYCVSIDTRQGERQVSLQEPGQQPQHPPLCPPTPVAEPLRFYRNPHSPEVPCAVPALQHGHRDVNRQPLPQQAATRMEHTAAQPVYHSEPLHVPQTQHEPQVQYRAATRMEHTAAQPVYHSEPLYVPQTQHEPQVPYRAVVDRHGQHILPEDSS